jgi:YD repeat-containing protein
MRDDNRSLAARVFLIFAFLVFAASLLCAEDRVERRADPRGSRELVFHDKILVEEHIYGPDAALLEDILYEKGKPREIRSYIRVDGRLMRVEARNANGSLIGQLLYFYDTNGSLLHVAASGSFGASSAGMLDSGSTPLASWTIHNAELSLVRYDSQGRPILNVSEKDGKPIATRGDSYAQGPFPQRTVVSDELNGQTRTTDYDTSGRPTLLVVADESNQISRTDYRYDSSGRLVEERTQKGLDLLSRRLSYDESGALVREEYRNNGTLRTVILQPGDNRVEEHFQDGVMFVRVSFSKGRKIQEDFFIDGHLAWTKEYP